MRRLEMIHGVVALLIAGSSCGTEQKVRHVATVPRANIQATVDECVKKEGKKACQALCERVFGRPNLQHCGIEEKQDTADVWHEDNESDADRDPPQGCAPGRRPAGLVCVAHAPTVAGYFAWAAQMEAASITAFARVYRELVALGADAALLARVHRACGDEVAHAIAMVALARRYGANPAAPVIEEPERSLEQRAIENAVEGCVGETVAAIHAAFLATHAHDRQVRDVFAQIAVDESTHALLSFDLAAVYANALDDRARARVHAAYVRALASPALREVTPALAALGVPDDGTLGATIDRVLAALAPRFMA